jgi:membrane protease YdiL (CAAX protease family)
LGFFKKLGWALTVRLAIQAAAFSLFHIWEGPFGVLNAFLAGLAFGFAREKGLVLPSLALSHAAWDITALLL